MVEIKTEYPLILDGVERKDLIKHYAVDENGIRYLMTQGETGHKYAEAVDLYPCKYSYTATEEPVDREIEGE